MILTSNHGLSEWAEVFGDPVVATALLDRLLHHAVVVHIEGASYRLRQHADLFPEDMRQNGPAHPQPAAAQRRRGRPQSSAPIFLNPPLVRPAGGVVDILGTPFVPTHSDRRGAQEPSRDEPACGARLRASLDGSEHRGPAPGERLTHGGDYNTQRPHTSLNGLTPEAFAARPSQGIQRADSAYDRGHPGGRGTFRLRAGLWYSGLRAARLPALRRTRPEWPGAVSA